MSGCVLSQLKPSEFYILKNVKLLGLYPVWTRRISDITEHKISRKFSVMIAAQSSEV